VAERITHTTHDATLNVLYGQYTMTFACVAFMAARKREATSELSLVLTPELSESGGTEKEPHRTRTRVDHVPDIAGVGVKVPLNLVNRSAQCPSDHVLPLVANSKTP